MLIRDQRSANICLLLQSDSTYLSALTWTLNILQIKPTVVNIKMNIFEQNFTATIISMPATRLILVIIGASERSFNVFNPFTSAGYKL